MAAAKKGTTASGKSSSTKSGAKIPDRFVMKESDVKITPAPKGRTSKGKGK
jgi:hypothetical protein